MVLPGWTRNVTRELMSGSVEEVTQRLRTALEARDLPATALRGLDRVLGEAKRGADHLRRWAQRRSSLSHAAINASGIALHDDLVGVPLSDAVWHTIVPEQGLADTRLPAVVDRIERQFGSAVEKRTGRQALMAHSTEAALLAIASSLPAESTLVSARVNAFRPEGGLPLPQLLAAGGARVVEVGTADDCRPTDWCVETSEAATRAIRVEVDWPVATTRRTAPTPGKDAGAGVPQRRLVLAPYGCLVPLTGAVADCGTLLEARQLADNWLTVVPCDRWLGGPRGALILGSTESLERISQVPLWTVCRAALGTMAAMTETLQQVGMPDSWVLKALETSEENLQNRCERLATQLAGSPAIASCEILREPARLAPDLAAELPSRQLRLMHANEAAQDWQRELAAESPAILATACHQTLTIDLRWIPPSYDDLLASHLGSVQPAPTAGGGD